MIHCDNLSIHSTSIHYIGNKATDSYFTLSNESVELSDALSEILVQYFITPFKSSEYFNLYHESDINLNEVYCYVSKIFDDCESLHEQSVNLAKHLYEQSNHPNIKDGEFYVVYFNDCVVDGDTVDAVGLFKSENKDTFLKVNPSGGTFGVESQQGVNIKKLDKGCLIFNIDRECGYKVTVVDSTNKGAEAHYWVDDFLHLRQRKDEYYNTQNVMTLAKNFATDELPKNFDVSKADQAELLNKSVKFFKDKDTFDMDEFANEVIAQPEVIESFNKYKESYAKERDIEFVESFSISDSAVKKQSRILKSVIKLDKNFHIYVHGNTQYIKKGYDEESGMHYYQLFFNDEE